MFRRLLTSSLVMALFLTLIPMPFANAAAIEFTDTVQAQLNATADRAGGTVRGKLIKQYDDFKSERKQAMDWDDRISSLRYANEAKASETRKRISEIDKDKIRKLEDQLQAAKTKYQPLFNTYTALNKQIAAAKKLKDKTLSKMLQSQAGGMKLLVTLGREDIRNKQAALTAAKKEKTSKAAKVRSILSEIESYKSKIKGDKSAISTPNKLMTTEWKNFKTAVKANESARTSDTLSRLLTLSGQILTKKKSIYSHEQKIESIIARANAQLK
jgi:predicted nuclease with TOPRIM domain